MINGYMLHGGFQIPMQSSYRCILECKERLQSVKFQVLTVTGPIVQVYEHNGARRHYGCCIAKLSHLSVNKNGSDLTIAGWAFFSGPKPGLKNSACENKVYPAGADSSLC